MAIILIIIASGPLFAQEKLFPPQPKIQDRELQEFILDLKEAVHQKDETFILNNMSPQMQNSFGGDGGIDEFKEYWNWDVDPSEFWKLMEKLLELGGEAFREGDSYSIPYIFSLWPGHEQYNAFEHMAITGASVNVRELPNTQSKVIGQLTYDIVKVNYDKSFPAFNSSKIDRVSFVGDKEWYYIESLDHSISGFVNWNYVWSPIGYRMRLYKMDGKWVISSLLAGD